MSDQLKGRRVAILADNGFEQSELEEPKMALEKAGALAQVVSPQSNKITGWKHTDWGDTVPVDVSLAQARPEDFDALVLPGGVMNPDLLRINEQAKAFARHFVAQNKPIAAICHGPWLLVEIGGAKGKKLTSYPSIQTDLKNAGANWVDEPVVVDGNLVTSRKPDDLPAFTDKMVSVFAQPQPALSRR